MNVSKLSTTKPEVLWMVPLATSLAPMLLAIRISIDPMR